MIALLLFVALPIAAFALARFYSGSTGPALAAAFIASTLISLLMGPYAGTCTQGDGGQLLFPLFALPGMAGTLLTALLTTEPRKTTLALLPFSPALLWAMGFALTLAQALLIKGATACAFLESMPETEPDGRESFYAQLWLLTAVALPLAIAVTLAIRFRKPSSPHPR